MSEGGTRILESENEVGGVWREGKGKCLESGEIDKMR